MSRRRIITVATLAFLCVGGCTSRPSHHEEPRHYGPKVNIQDFTQNTVRYKGRIITVTLRVNESIDRSQGKSLRDYIGRDVNFASIGSQGERLNLVIKIPEGIPVPELGQSDEVSVTFVCTRGMLRQGNEAKIIEKPKA